MTSIPKRHHNPGSTLLILGSLIVLGANFFLSQPLQLYATVAGVVVSLCALAVRSSPQPDAELDQQRQALEEWRAAQSTLFAEQSARLQEQQRDIVTQLARVQEVLEYPIVNPPLVQQTLETQQLSEQDRQVHRILEFEAARIYEKIRSNGYSSSGKIDVDGIRTEVLALIQNVAHVYSPESENPLLETSFEQLARSASRICLHMLVLLEQLPLDVKRYNLREMYGYVRKAVQGYGTYQQVAPWLKHLTRGAYVGRMAAGTNPVSLGAWWLATEVGRRGAQKFVENVVDRQAVAALNDIVTIIGVEVANVYGPGFRQRDAAWVLGTELTELLAKFPISRESLQDGLRAVSALPLRSEYDRIYLYRCVAEHRSAGLRINNPAMLTRDEREQIATQLEAFLTGSIHGVQDEQRAAWRADVESRLDLKLHPTTSGTTSGNSDQAKLTVTSVYLFLTSVAGVTPESAIRFIRADGLIKRVPVAERDSHFKELQRLDSTGRFEPPDLDPSSELTSVFLNSLMSGALHVGECDDNIEALLIEIACYFRHQHDAARQMVETAQRNVVQNRCLPQVSVATLDHKTLRTLWRTLTDHEYLSGVFSEITIQTGEAKPSSQAGHLFVIHHQEKSRSRLALIEQDAVVWAADAWQCSRVRGYFIDDCQIRGGVWQSPPAPKSDSLVVAASITGGGYAKYFASLLINSSSSGNL